jgi:type I restriction enzyme S subunit
MHDLLNRGLDENGQLRRLREEAQDQYKNTSTGWIPKDWSPFALGSVVDSIIDGPFGSNLKTEHYVEDGGVRVVRLQNVQAGFYNDSDKAFVSERHARFLSKNSVVSGDVLIAALGDENYPVGRACLYPTNLPPAINKADCFRLRSLPSKALNSFIMNYLNTPAARSQIDRYKQGVTRQRVNTTNLKKVIVPLPPPDEQKRIADRIALAEASLHTLTEFREKLLMLKRGLMNDLLNGTIPVVVEERIEAQANV